MFINTVRRKKFRDNIEKNPKSLIPPAEFQNIIWKRYSNCSRPLSLKTTKKKKTKLPQLCGYFFRSRSFFELEPQTIHCSARSFTCQISQIDSFAPLSVPLEVFPFLFRSDTFNSIHITAGVGLSSPKTEDQFRPPHHLYKVKYQNKLWLLQGWELKTPCFHLFKKNRVPQTNSEIIKLFSKYFRCSLSF